MDSAGPERLEVSGQDGTERPEWTRFRRVPHDAGAAWFLAKGA